MHIVEASACVIDAIYETAIAETLAQVNLKRDRLLP